MAETDPFVRPSIVPEAERWREALENQKAAQEAERKLAREQQAEHEEMVLRWKLTVQEMEAQRDDAVRRCNEAELNAMRKVQDHHWQTVQATAELEDRIQQLEQLLEDERNAHTHELQHQASVLEQARQECFMQLQDAEQRHQAAMATAKAQLREAEDMAELTKKRANADVAAARAREDQRVAEIRAQTNARVRELEMRMRDETNMRDQHLVERQKLMEDAVYSNSREKQEAVDAARRHLAAMEHELQLNTAQLESLHSHKESRLDEFKETEKQNAEALVKHHKDMLDLEQSLHARTMERTMDRVTRHLKLPNEPDAPAVHFGVPAATAMV